MLQLLLRRCGIKGTKPTVTKPAAAGELAQGELWLNNNHESPGLFARADDDTLITFPSDRFLQDGANAKARTYLSKLKDVVSVKDFGAVADGDFATGAGTDNTAAFQAAINSHTAPGKGGASVYVPRGVYKLAGQITIPAGATIYGDGKWSSVVFCPSAFADLTGLVRLGGGGGPPTGIHGLGILAQTGGAPGRGLVIVSNGSFASDLWVNGFALGIHIDSTDVFLSDFAAELSTVNVYISQSNVGVSHGTVYGGTNGITIANNAAVSPGTVHITGVRATSCDQAGLIVAAGKNVVFAGCSVDHDNAGKLTVAGFLIDTSTNVTLTGCAAAIGTGQSTTAAGVKAINSTNIGISATSASGFLDGFSTNGCGNVRVSGGSFTNNGRSGCWLQGGDNIAVVGNTFLNEGAIATAQEHGINSVNRDVNSTHMIVGNICSQASGAGHLQDYGILADAGPTSTTIISGNVCRFNGTSDIYLASQTGRILLDGNIADRTNATPPAVASAAALTLPPGAAFVSITGADNITSIAATGFGRKSVTLVFAATATVTKGGNLKIASTLTATADDTLTLYCDGTDWVEVSRSIN